MGDRPFLCRLDLHKGSWSPIALMEGLSGRQGFREQRKCDRCGQIDQRVRWERIIYE